MEKKSNFFFNNCYFCVYSSELHLKGSKVVHGRLFNCFWAFFGVYYSQELIYHLKYHFKFQNFVTRLMVLGMWRNCLSWFQDLKLRICLFQTEIYKLFIINDAVLLFSQICPFSFLQLVKVIRGFIDVCSTSTLLKVWNTSISSYFFSISSFI